jgi:hypothetical protein
VDKAVNQVEKAAVEKAAGLVDKAVNQVQKVAGLVDKTVSLLAKAASLMDKAGGHYRPYA